MLKDKSTLRQQGEEVRRRENASCTLVHYLENKLHTQSLKSSAQSSNVEAIEADLQRQLCQPRWGAGSTSKGTMNSGTSLLQRRIACKIKN